MIFSLAIYSSPSSCSGINAYQFAKAAIDSGHDIYRIFFYHEGVYHASALNTPPQDEIASNEQWQALAEENDIDLVVCIAAGLRRGILDQQESDRYEKTTYNLASSFELSGLGQLLDATVNSDRLITFWRLSNMKLLFILRHSPYGNLLAKEALDAILASSAYGQELSVLFMDDGVFQLISKQAPQHQKNVGKTLSAFELYDIDQLFVCRQSLEQRGIAIDDLSIPVSIIDNTATQELMAQQDRLLSF